MATHIQLLSVFQQFCEAEKCHFYPLGSSSFATYVSGHSNKWQTMVTVKDTRITIFSDLPFIIPPEKRLTVLEFLMWANCQLPLGNFEFNLQQSGIRFKTSMEVADGVLTTRMLGILLYTNLNAANIYSAGLQQILFAGKTLAEAIRFLCEPAETEEEEEDKEETEALREMLDDPDLAKLLGDDRDTKKKGAGD